MGNIKIGDRLESTAASGIVAGANAIYDDSRGKTQSSINIYAIDRESKTVRVARVGANINRDMEDRKWMIIPYKDV